MRVTIDDHSAEAMVKEKSKSQEEANEVKLRWLPAIILILAMVFVSSTAFGDVNQFEIETGLTVNALMFPDVISERTVEAMWVNFGDFEFHSEFTFAKYENLIEEIMTSAQLMGDTHDNLLGVVKGHVDWNKITYSVGIRINGPLLSG